MLGAMTRTNRKMGDSKLAVGYVRASKDDQKLTPDAQRASIEAWAKRNGVSVVAWHVDMDVCSVTEAADRPGLAAALASLRGLNAGVLAVAKRDRVGRDVVLVASIERAAASQGARIMSAAGEGTEGANDPSAMLMRGVVDLFAAHELQMIRSRTRAALAVKKARGERTGNLPYGFRLAADGVHVEPHEGEQSVIARIRQARTDGLSLREIVAELSRAGVLGRTGRPLAITQVANVVNAR